MLAASSQIEKEGALRYKSPGPGGEGLTTAAQRRGRICGPSGRPQPIAGMPAGDIRMR